MKARCTNPNHPAAHNYGSRGITVSKAWADSFAVFAQAVGQPPSALHQLDRIDNNRGYEPGNVRWATAHENSRNKRTNLLLTHEGRTLCAAEWATELGIPATNIYARLRRGLPIEKALFGGQLSELPRAHGTRRGYDGGCRCGTCRAFNASRATNRRHKLQQKRGPQ